MSDIQDCPHCHSKNVAVNSILREHFVACLNPNCMHHGPLNASQSEAITLWNKQAGSDPGGAGVNR